MDRVIFIFLFPTATDGLWDVMTSQAAVDYVSDSLVRAGIIQSRERDRERGREIDDNGEGEGGGFVGDDKQPDLPTRGTCFLHLFIFIFLFSFSYFYFFFLFISFRLDQFFL